MTNWYVPTDPNPAERMLLLLRANPTLLPLAPEDADGEHIEHRRNDEVHMCLRCGQRAQCAFIAHTQEGMEERRRWLDLCYECAHWLRTTLPPEPLYDPRNER